jgi:hypothetical protein
LRPEASPLCLFCLLFSFQSLFTNKQILAYEFPRIKRIAIKVNNLCCSSENTEQYSAGSSSNLQRRGNASQNNRFCHHNHNFCLHSTDSRQDFFYITKYLKARSRFFYYVVTTIVFKVKYQRGKVFLYLP